MRRNEVIQRNIDSLKALERRSSKIAVAVRSNPESHPAEISVVYNDTLGLIKTSGGLEMCDRWMILIALGPMFPVTSPEVCAAPLRGGRPWHPNIMPVLPFRLCYGRHPSCMLLDKLVLNIERMLVLDPKVVMTDESQSFNHDACIDVRVLIREGYAPLVSGRALPAWCKNEESGVVGG